MAIELCAQAPLAVWDSAQVLATVAQQLSRVGTHQQAREFARAALARDPKHPPSLYMLGNLEVYFGETDAAAELLERCIDIHPGAIKAR